MKRIPKPYMPNSPKQLLSTHQLDQHFIRSEHLDLGVSFFIWTQEHQNIAPDMERLVFVFLKRLRYTATCQTPGPSRNLWTPGKGKALNQCQQNLPICQGGCEAPWPHCSKTPQTPLEHQQCTSLPLIDQQALPQINALHSARCLQLLVQHWGGCWESPICRAPTAPPS